MSEVYLAHHGVLGQKWGVRRYQDKYGKSTPLGRQRKRDSETKKAYYEARIKKKKTGEKPKDYNKVAGKQALAAVEKYALNERSRARLHDNIDANKSIPASYIKAYLGTQIKDLAASGAIGFGAGLATAAWTKNEKATTAVISAAARLSYTAIQVNRLTKAVRQYIPDKKR